MVFCNLLATLDSHIYELKDIHRHRYDTPHDARTDTFSDHSHSTILGHMVPHLLALLHNHLLDLAYFSPFLAANAQITCRAIHQKHEGIPVCEHRIIDKNHYSRSQYWICLIGDGLLLHHIGTGSKCSHLPYLEPYIVLDVNLDIYFLPSLIPFDNHP